MEQLYQRAFDLRNAVNDLDDAGNFRHFRSKVVTRRIIKPYSQLSAGHNTPPFPLPTEISLNSLVNQEGSTSTPAGIRQRYFHTHKYLAAAVFLCCAIKLIGAGGVYSRSFVHTLIIQGLPQTAIIDIHGQRAAASDQRRFFL